LAQTQKGGGLSIVAQESGGNKGPKTNLLHLAFLRKKRNLEKEKIKSFNDMLVIVPDEVFRTFLSLAEINAEISGCLFSGQVG
jgi:hypothetical protein